MPVPSLQKMTTGKPSMPLKEPWYIDGAEFNEEAKCMCVRVREISKYECPECGALCTRYDNENKERRRQAPPAGRKRKQTPDTRRNMKPRGNMRNS